MEQLLGAKHHADTVKLPQRTQYSFWPKAIYQQSEGADSSNTS